MKRPFLAFATLLGVSLAVACSSGGQQGQTTGNQAAATPTPIATPTLLNMNASAPRSCATNAAGRSAIYDLITGQQLNLTSNQELVKGFPPGGPANAWGLYQLHPQAFIRYTVPFIPELVGKINLSIHDETTIAIMPYATSQEQTLFNDYVKHVQYTDKVAAEARAAELNNTAMPTPDPQESTAESYYNKVEQPLIAAESMGTTPDDTDYQNASGNPNAQTVHTYDYACDYLDATQYALVWNLETRVLQVTNAYTTVTATLSANKAQPQTIQNVGWVPRWLITCVAVPVKPLAITYNPNQTPSPGVNVPYAQNYPFKEAARMDLTTPATATPSPPPPPALPPPAPSPTPSQANYVNCVPS
jgi:hypothetical protein